MNSRERILVLAVGGLFLAIALQYGIGKFQSAKLRRDNQITTLQQQLLQGQERQLLSEQAISRMGDLQVRSLPSDLELARSDYSSWLTLMGTAAGLNNLSVNYVNQAPNDDLYQQISFDVRGTGDLEELVWMLHAFHSKDYLHRIRTLSVKKSSGGDSLSIAMDVEVLALTDAPADLQPPSEPSPAVNPSVDYYTDVILNRNFVAPPNRAPQFAADTSVEAIVGRDFTFTAEFSDPDGDAVEYALADDAPEDVQIDRQSGRLRFTPDSVGKYEVTVLATDQGLPAQSSEQKLVINVVEPEPEPEPAPAFDEASQAVLTALVQSRGDWAAWIHLRTQGKVIKLRAGDSFELGSLQGTVANVTQRAVDLEINGRTFTLHLDGNLGEAIRASDVD